MGALQNTSAMLVAICAAVALPARAAVPGAGDAEPGAIFVDVVRPPPDPPAGEAVGLIAWYPPRLGVQAALASPAGGDLTLTTGFPISGNLGIHGEWMGEQFLLRPRLDLGRYWVGTQVASQPGLSQRIRTEVSDWSLGFDAMVRGTGFLRRLAVGGNLALVRWTVASRNSVTAGNATAVVTGTSSWWRAAAGASATWQLSPTLDLEGRLLLSRYGQQDLKANVITLGVLWRTALEPHP